jgi:hypothetical protein
MDDYDLLQRVYAEVGGVQHAPEHLDCLPRDKHDVARANAAAELGFPAVAPVLLHLLTWLQDGNWPVSHPIAGFLRTVGEPLVEPVRLVLQSRDHVWKYWVLVRLVKESPALREGLRNDLHRIAEAPLPGECEEGLQELASDILNTTG